MNDDYTALLPKHGQHSSRNSVYERKVYKYSTGKFMFKMCLRKLVLFCSQWRAQWFQIFCSAEDVVKVDTVIGTMSWCIQEHRVGDITNISFRIAMQTWTAHKFSLCAANIWTPSPSEIPHPTFSEPRTVHHSVK